MTAKQLTRIGIFYIEEAILDTLSQAESEWVRGVDISRACGLTQFRDESQWIVSRVLYNLEEDGRVESRRSGERQHRTGWKLSTRERNRRVDISN